MRATRRSVLVLALSCAGLLASAAPAKAFWPKATYRQRTVVRGGWWPGVVGVPAFGVGGIVAPQGFFFGTASPTIRQSFLLGDTFSYGLQQGFLLGDGGTDAVTEAAIRQAAARIIGAMPQAGGRSPDSVGNTPGTGTPPATTACTGLSDRLDKISTRLETLQTSLTSIEKKVDLIVTEVTQRKMQEQQEQVFQGLMKPVLAAIAADRQKQNRDLAFLFRQLLISDPAKRDKTQVEQILSNWEK